MAKIYFQLRSKFGVRTLADTNKLSDLILMLKRLEVSYSVFKSEDKKNWQKVEGVYDAGEQ